MHTSGVNAIEIPNQATPNFCDSIVLPSAMRQELESHCNIKCKGFPSFDVGGYFYDRLRMSLGAQYVEIKTITFSISHIENRP